MGQFHFCHPFLNQQFSRSQVNLLKLSVFFWLYQMTFQLKAQYTILWCNPSAQKIEFDIRERSSGLAEPWDPGEAGGTGLVAPWPPVAPCGPAGFVLALVSALGPPHLCWALLIFPPVSCGSHGLVRPPPRPHPEPGSALAITCNFCVCVYVHACAYRTIAGVQLTSRGLRTGVTFTSYPWILQGNPKAHQHFPCFSFVLWGQCCSLQLTVDLW